MIYHRANKMASDGSVSALCFSIPHPIDLKKASWIIRDDAVTCSKCKAKIAAGYKDKYSVKPL